MLLIFFFDYYKDGLKNNKKVEESGKRGGEIGMKRGSGSRADRRCNAKAILREARAGDLQCDALSRSSAGKKCSYALSRSSAGYLQYDALSRSSAGKKLNDTLPFGSAIRISGRY
jgi:hypothetical protein